MALYPEKQLKTKPLFYFLSFVHINIYLEWDYTNPFLCFVQKNRLSGCFGWHWMLAVFPEVCNVILSYLSPPIASPS